jgi:hypothetical protein
MLRVHQQYRILGLRYTLYLVTNWQRGGFIDDCTGETAGM